MESLFPQTVKMLSIRNKSAFDTHRGNYPHSEKMIIFAICISVSFSMVDSLVNNFMQIEFWDSLVTKGIYYISLIIALYYSLQRLSMEMIILPLIVLVLWLFSYFFFPINRQSLTDEGFITEIIVSLPIYVITLAVRDFKSLYKALRITSIVVIICAIFYLNLQQDGEVEIEYMHFSYGISLSVMLLLIISLQNKNKIDILLSFIGVCIVLVSGARGAFLGLLIGFIFYVLINIRLTVKSIIIALVMSVIIVVVSTNYTLLLNLLSDNLDSLHIPSRTVRLLIENKVGNASGRDDLFERALSEFYNNFVSGAGMTGDRSLLGSYSHNLFTEILLEYGVILGVLLTIILLRILLIAFFTRNKDELYYIYLATVFTTGFIKLQFSSSYLIEPTFYMMLALGIKLIKKPTNFFALK